MELFTANSELQICEQLLRLFIKDYKFDLLKKTELIGKDKQITKCKSAMEDLLKVLCQRKLSNKKKKDLNAKI